MRLFYSVADAFIMTFGITPPKPERRKIAAIFINIILLAMILGVLALFILTVAHLIAR